MVKEEFFLPWEARALDGLELPESAEKNVAAVISISLSSVSGVEKTRHFNWLSGRDATKRAVYGDEVGGKLRLDGRRNATNWAFDPGAARKVRARGGVDISAVLRFAMSLALKATERWKEEKQVQRSNATKGAAETFASVAAKAARISNETKRADFFCERFHISRSQMRLNGRENAALVDLDGDATKWAHTMMVFTLSCFRY